MKWLAGKLPFLQNPGSPPSTALIMGDWLGTNFWNYCEGWENTLAEMNHPFRAYHVGSKPKKIKALFSQLKKNPPELVLLPCGDHHLFHLHDTEEKRDFWRSLKSKTICFCLERVVNSPYPASEEKTKSAIDAFDGFIYVDEFAESRFADAGKPALWSCQYSDERLFYPRVPYEQRQNQIYFRASLNNVGFEKVYEERLALIARVRSAPGFMIHDQLLSPKIFAEELSTQRFVLRTASNCPGYVENFWNSLASGCVVFHQKLPASEVRSIGIVKPGRDFIEYDASKPQELIAQAQEVLKNWRDYQTMAETGRQTFLAGFTLRKFLEKLLNFADTQVKTK